MLLLLSLACTSTPDDSGAEPHYDAPDSEGSFTAISKQDLLTGRSGVELPVQLWYPSLDSERGELVEYEGILEGQARSLGQAACDIPRPVLLFSHGNGGARWQSTFFTERLAAHGYIVAAPDHVGNTLFDIDEVPRDEIALRRPHDISDTFDWLVARSADPESDIYGCVDSEAGYAVAGHSFGGFTTLFLTGAAIDRAALTAACASEVRPWLCGIEALSEQEIISEQDERIWAAIAMTPVGAQTFALGLGEQSTPILVMGGSLDDLTTMEEQVTPIFEGVGGQPAYLANIEGAGHYSFSAMCGLLPGFNGCGEGFLNADQTLTLINEMSLAFLGQERGFDGGEWLPPEGPVEWSER